jgi:hydroxymethylglutaryl-CoA reductase
VTIGDFHNGPATQIVTVTLTGTNDPTVIVAAATTASGAITELPGVTGSTVTDLATGTIAFTDADLSDTHRVVSVVPQGAGYSAASRSARSRTAPAGSPVRFPGPSR